MAEESFLLVSLEQQKSKKLAEVISNDTCRRILEALAKKEMSETEISQTLLIPLSTAHYNLKNLVGAKLVLANEFHYSSRGKEVIHYKLANKIIIIAPQEADAAKFTDILKKYVPAATLILTAGVVLELLQSLFTKSMAKASFGAIDNAATPVLESAPRTGARLINAATPAPSAVMQSTPVVAWLVLGAFAGLLVVFFIDLLRSSRHSRRSPRPGEHNFNKY